MGEILVGTCSRTDRALVGSGWYPAGRRDAEGRLRYYAERFPVVEVDSAYYALPGARDSRLWAERTPEGFVFDVKAFSLRTGHPTRDSAMPDGLPAEHRDPKVLEEVWARFTEGIEPLRAAGPVTPVTCPRLSVVRFHGRSPAWGTGSREDRFRHDCSEPEPSEWLPRLHALAARVDRLHVLFDNCCGTAAVRAAETMRRLLGTAAPPSPAQ